MELIELNGMRGVAHLGGVSREVNLMLVPEVKIGDYLIIHAGCAISVLSPEEAQKTIDLLRSATEITDDGEPS
jgi:hydrogenase expression/formation protein HypC